MFRSTSFGWIAFLALAGLMSAAQTSQAQVFFHGGRGGWGVNVGTPYYGGYWGGPYRYGYSSYYPYGYSYSPYASAYSPYGYGYSYPYYYDTMPYYTQNYGYMPMTYSYQSLYPPLDGQSSSAEMNPQNGTARIEVTLPPNAQLMFDNSKTQQTGAMRYFTTPPLESGHSYSYVLTATWMEQAGKEVRRTRTVNVSPNQRAVVNFMETQPQDQIEPKGGGTPR